VPECGCGSRTRHQNRGEKNKQPHFEGTARKHGYAIRLYIGPPMRYFSWEFAGGPITQSELCLHDNRQTVRFVLHA
jgi:hypothetical protein